MSNVCSFWKRGSCTRKECPYLHSKPGNDEGALLPQWILDKVGEKIISIEVPVFDSQVKMTNAHDVASYNWIKNKEVHAIMIPGLFYLIFSFSY
jgi:hypothetical protein